MESSAAVDHQCGENTGEDIKNQNGIAKKTPPRIKKNQCSIPFTLNKYWAGKPKAKLQNIATGMPRAHNIDNENESHEDLPKTASAKQAPSVTHTTPTIAEIVRPMNMRRCFNAL